MTENKWFTTADIISKSGELYDMSREKEFDQFHKEHFLSSQAAGELADQLYCKVWHEPKTQEHSTCKQAVKSLECKCENCLCYRRLRGGGELRKLLTKKEERK